MWAIQMQSGFLKLKIKVKRHQNESSSSVLPGQLGGMKRQESSLSGPTFPGHQDNIHQKSVDTTLVEGEANHNAEDEDNQSSENAQNQLVVYDPTANGAGEIEAAPEPIVFRASPFQNIGFSGQTSRVLPSVGAFTVQCANCFKWRLIPTKEKYEEIREHILEQPFTCETAREWRREVSCDDPPDIVQDGSRLWAIDKPSIAQPPAGWQRLLRIRGEGSTKFADVYYVAPSGKRLRSTVEIQKFLEEHPEYIEQGVHMAQFSFQIPKPLQENYVRKRPIRVPTPHDGSSIGMSASLEPTEANPIAWATPDENTDLQLGQPGLSSPDLTSPVSEPRNEPAKKQKKMTPSKEAHNSNSSLGEQSVKVEERHQP